MALIREVYREVLRHSNQFRMHRLTGACACHTVAELERGNSRADFHNSPCAGIADAFHAVSGRFAGVDVGCNACGSLFYPPIAHDPGRSAHQRRVGRHVRGKPACLRFQRPQRCEFGAGAYEGVFDFD